ncbi:hypothetical protein CAPTEDRAFT_203186 [Capitella teleta]|uniref:C-type lectin domain-containing protein n=1 Tax=Capitella teleta TaxID=283909 RepID=R7U6P1_CAPTE|nr:hypothetical protein CAPTEDRAFT_203186 [Capitella teleta]|eukprot:ELU01816.1 hypothetical protein CAPTEDRAFT_203186 [Capitella teleta]
MKMGGALCLSVACMVALLGSHCTEAYLTCPQAGYNLYGRKCYKSVYDTSGVNAYKANTACKNDGGVLAGMANYQESLAVLTSLVTQIGWKLTSYDRVWIGLNDMWQEGTYKWRDKTLLNETVNIFASGQGTKAPAGTTGGKDCSQLEKKQVWDHRSCTDTSTKGYICEMEPEGEWEDVIECSYGGGSSIISGGKCMFLVKGAGNYFKSTLNCRSAHPQADLTKVDSWEDFNAVINLMNENSIGTTGTVWLGATRMFPIGGWVNMDGTAVQKGWYDGNHFLCTIILGLQSTNTYVIASRTNWLMKLWSYALVAGAICSYDLAYTGKPTDTLMASIIGKEFYDGEPVDSLEGQSMQTCVDHCCALGSNQCKGVNYNMEHRECWVVTTDDYGSFTDTTDTTQGVVHFSRFTAPYCTPNFDDNFRFSILENTERRIETESPDVEALTADDTGKESCKSKCKQNAACGAATFYANGTCAIYEDDFDRLNGGTESPYRYKSGATTFRRNGCRVCATTQCPDGFRPIGDYCYKVVAQAGANRFDGAAGCSADTASAVLAKIREPLSSYVPLWAVSLAKHATTNSVSASLIYKDAGLTSGTDVVWISLTDAQMEGTWRWNDGSVYYGYTANYKSYMVTSGTVLSPTWGAGYAAKGYMCEKNYELSSRRHLHIWTTDFHIATIQDIRHLLEPIGVTFFDQSLTPRCKLFNSCAYNLTILNRKNGIHLNHSLIPQFYDRYKDDWQMQQVDAFVCYHPTSLCELYMPFNRSIIVVASTRYELGRQDRDTWTKWNENLQKLSQHPKNIIAANNLYDSNYIEYFTGIKAKLIPSICDYTNVTYNPSINTFLLFAGRTANAVRFQFFSELFNETCAIQNCSELSLVHFRTLPVPYKYGDIARHKGFVLIPYQVSTMSLFEHYRMNVPIFAPSVELLIEWHQKHNILREKTWNGVTNRTIVSQGSHISAHDSQKHLPDPNNDTDPESLKYWIPFSDFYQWPHVIIFNTLDELIIKMRTTDLNTVSQLMKQHNLQEKERVMNIWKKVLLQVSKYSDSHCTATRAEEETLQ